VQLQVHEDEDDLDDDDDEERLREVKQKSQQMQCIAIEDADESVSCCWELLPPVTPALDERLLSLPPLPSLP
jgi:hypothetical protein